MTFKRGDSILNEVVLKYSENKHDFGKKSLSQKKLLCDHATMRPCDHAMVTSGEYWK